MNSIKKRTDTSMEMLVSVIIICSSLLTAFYGCKAPSARQPVATNNPQLFTLLSPSVTQVDFSNQLTEGNNTNIMMYEYFYNGGGVAIGDVNNDGLDDIYFSSNMGANKLYLNRGGMKFEDITAASNTAGRPGPWKTGITMADVNGDGRMDIYVCYSGKMPSAKRTNQLFINEGNDSNGRPFFTERAAEMGLADTGFSTQAYFFDYDLDGDLDMFLLHHNPDNLAILDEAATRALLKEKNENIGVKLFRNDNGHFVEVTEHSGLSSSVLTYGLSAGIADINKDGWPDIYVSNDYGVPDYLYINNKDGTFTDQLQQSLGHTSQFSMGNTICDINNDGLPDIITLDMLPEDNHRQKLLFAPDNYEKFDLGLRTGFYYQYMRNMFHLNNGNGTFSEIGQLAGISNTDWSWTPLSADYDNDGWKDLYVTNGYLRDYTNMDFIKYMNDFIQSKGRLRKEEVLELVKSMPSTKLTNYMFRNQGSLKFQDVGQQWGMTLPSISSGAAYADLDNDGDLDMVVNNINEPAFIYQNNASAMLSNNYLAVKLAGRTKNTSGIGAKVTIYCREKQQYQEQMTARGFQSTVSSILHFGLGSDTLVDSLNIQWPGGKEQDIKKIKSGQLITLEEKNAVGKWKEAALPKPIFKQVPAPINYNAVKSAINDFKRQPLLINPLSFTGPCLAKGDVNGDGLEDVYVGGSNGQVAMLYLQQKNKTFQSIQEPAFISDEKCEDADALFVDVNNDGFIDLYVASGGYANYQATDTLLQDRLYMNDGKGHFTKAPAALPSMKVSKSCVRAVDINDDGYMDLFVGGRSIPGRYPEAPESFLLINNRNGTFTDATSTIAPGLRHPGMVTDAAWLDVNHDQKPDLVIVGEWMPIMVFVNQKGTLQDRTGEYFTKEYRGWWNKLLVTDINSDGLPDLVVGNMGANTQCRASEKEPAEMYYKDFDHNGSVDPIFCMYVDHKSYPYVSRDELLDQMAIMRTRFPDYKSYADAALQDIFKPEELQGAGHLTANVLTTTCFELTSSGKFQERSLPLQAQFSPVFVIAPLDYDKDGKVDLLLCGNISRSRLRFGKSDANYGMLFKGDGKGGFTYISQSKAGFNIKGDVRSCLQVNDELLFGINEAKLEAYRKN